MAERLLGQRSIICWMQYRLPLDNGKPASINDPTPVTRNVLEILTGVQLPDVKLETQGATRLCLDSAAMTVPP